MAETLPRCPPRAITVAADEDGQRLDQFILKAWAGVPRALVYRLIRTKRVRVNNRRSRPDCRLRTGDRLQLPGITLPPSPPKPRSAPAAPLALPVLYEDHELLAVDKPAGLAVHGGSGEAHGVIERLRATRAPLRFLELAHRLDKETSGVLLLAKTRAALRAVQAQWRARRVHKVYDALVFGQWTPQIRQIKTPLKRIGEESGNRQVVVAADGKDAHTKTALLQQWQRTALLEATIPTGRMHQIRAHLASVGLPIVGDKKYGDFTANRQLRQIANKPARLLFLHAHRLQLTHPASEEPLAVVSSPPPEFRTTAAQLDARAMQQSR